MPDYKTTKIQQNAPQITFESPKSMPGKSDKLNNLINILDTGIKTAVVFDKNQTINEAKELGQELSNEYETISPTNINMLESERARLTDLADANPDDDAILNELNTITTSLGNAKAQGMSTYEYERRVLSKTQDLITANPAYADEITKQVNKTLTNRGINNLMKHDALLYDRQIKAKEAEFKVITDYLRNKKDEMILGMSNDEIFILYQQHKLKDKARRIIKDRVDDGTLLDKEVSQNFQEFIEANGGIQTVIASENQNILTEFTNIQKDLDSNAIDFNRAQELIQREMIDARKYLSAIAALPQTDENKLAYAQMDKFITNLEEASKAKLTGADMTAFLKNENDQIKAVREFGLLLIGKDKASTELALDEIKIFNFINESAGLSFASGEKQKRQQSIINLAVIAGKRFSMDNPAFKHYTKNGKMITSGIKELEPIFLKMMEQDKVSDEMFGYFNNLFTTSLHHKDNNDDRYEYDSNFLPAINNMDDTVFKYMLDNSETFLQDGKIELEFYSSAIIKEIQTNKLTPEDLEITDNGTFYSTTSQSGKQVAKKLNILLSLAVKFDTDNTNKTPTKEDALEIVRLLGIPNEFE
tara:strand:- start:2037 stop:3803 length:1767 start_codon:yes stop_codon:yes gene_type:complete